MVLYGLRDPSQLWRLRLRAGGGTAREGSNSGNSFGNHKAVSFHAFQARRNAQLNDQLELTCHGQYGLL